MTQAPKHSSLWISPDAVLPPLQRQRFLLEPLAEPPEEEFESSKDSSLPKCSSSHRSVSFILASVVPPDSLRSFRGSSLAIAPLLDALEQVDTLLSGGEPRYSP